MKKFVSVTAAIAIMASAFSPVVMANENVLKIETRRAGGIPSYGETLVSKGVGEGDTVTWQRIDSDEAVTTIGTGNEYVVTEEDAAVYENGKNPSKIQFTTGSASSEPVEIQNILTSPWPVNYVLKNANKQIPENSKFSVDGKSFSLAAVYDNDKSAYFVVANDLYGQYVRKDSKLDPNAEGNIQKWLNGSFITSGNDGMKLPDGIIEHIDRTHIWATEAAPASKSKWPGYTFKSGVTILSGSEMERYKDKIGYYLGQPYMLRSIVNWDGTPSGNRYAYCDGSTGGDEVMIKHDMVGSTSKYIRPVFYLDKDFFKTVKVDLANTGADVLDEIKKVDSAILESLYTHQELITYLGFEATEDDVVLKDFYIKTRSGNEAAYGETMQVFFDYDNERNTSLLKDYSVKWKIGDTVVGEGNEYVITEADCARKSYITDSETRTINADVTFEKVNGTKVTVTFNGVSFLTWEMPRRAGVHPVDKVSPVKKSVSAADEFVLDGKRFTLVKDFDNDKSTYFIAASQGICTHNGGNSVIMNSDSSGNLSNWLNNDFLSQLPSGMVTYMDKEHLWSTEGAPNSGIEDTYTFKAGVAVPSAAEFIRYNSTLAYDIGATYWLRTASNQAEARLMKIEQIDTTNNTDTQVKIVPNGLTDTSPYIRPVFYLNRDFFKNVAIDLNEAGDNVLAVMRKNYLIEDLSNLYDAAVLREKGFESIFDLTVKLTDENGEELTNSAETNYVNAEFSVINNRTEDFDAYIYLAVYDANNTLTGVKCGELSAAANGSHITKNLFLDLESIDHTQIKAFVWGKNLCPIQSKVLGTVSAPAAEAAISSQSRGNNFLE